MSSCHIFHWLKVLGPQLEFFFLFFFFFFSFDFLILMYRDHAVAVDEFAMFQPISFILWCMTMLSGKQNKYIVSNVHVGHTTIYP